jgi:hypothetical protein
MCLLPPQATESNAVEPTGTAAGSGSPGVATVTPTGTSTSQSNTQSTPSPTASKSFGYKTIVASGSLAWVVLLSMLFM